MAKEKLQPTIDPWTIIKYPLLSEKAIGKIETDNKLMFVVNRKSTKKQVKWAVEKALNVKVEKVWVMINQKGEKRVWVKLEKEFSASDIASRFGML